jgi:hypothetical protein
MASRALALEALCWERQASVPILLARKHTPAEWIGVSSSRQAFKCSMNKWSQLNWQMRMTFQLIDRDWDGVFDRVHQSDHSSLMVVCPFI